MTKMCSELYSCTRRKSKSNANLRWHTDEKPIFCNKRILVCGNFGQFLLILGNFCKSLIRSVFTGYFESSQDLFASDVNKLFVAHTNFSKWNDAKSKKIPIWNHIGLFSQETFNRLSSKSSKLGRKDLGQVAQLITGQNFFAKHKSRLDPNTSGTWRLQK